VAGTSFDPYDPVANITAACSYAAARYGSIDNVFSAY
jgi:SLT domain-containing protein